MIRCGTIGKRFGVDPGGWLSRRLARSPLSLVWRKFVSQRHPGIFNSIFRGDQVSHVHLSLNLAQSITAPLRTSVERLTQTLLMREKKETQFIATAFLRRTIGSTRLAPNLRLARPGKARNQNEVGALNSLGRAQSDLQRAINPISASRGNVKRSLTQHVAPVTSWPKDPNAEFGNHLPTRSKPGLPNRFTRPMRQPSPTSIDELAIPARGPGPAKQAWQRRFKMPKTVEHLPWQILANPSQPSGSAMLRAFKAGRPKPPLIPFGSTEVTAIRDVAERNFTKRSPERTWAKPGRQTVVPAQPLAMECRTTSQPTGAVHPSFLPTANPVSPPPPPAMPNVDQLVDEVMRRMDRHLRDERQRRGIAA